MIDRDLQTHILPATATVREVAAHMDRTKVPIVLVLDHGRLLGTVTEGDLRRAHLASKGPESRVDEVMSRTPIVARVDSSNEEREALLMRHRIQDLPIVDNQGRPVEIFTLRAAASRWPRSFRVAVVMAGGEGRRMRPLTDARPKPLVEVRGRPILEHIVERLQQAGIEQIYLSVNYKGSMIRDHFGDGAKWGLRIDYLEESRRLGTAGSLALLPMPPPEPLLVMNGDLLTTVDVGALWAFHVKHRGVMTVGSVEYIAEIPYGRLHLANHFLLDIQEKPEVRFQCAAGIYVLEPEVLDFVDRDGELDMPELIRTVIAAGLPVSVFPIRESWLDVATPDDLPG